VRVEKSEPTPALDPAVHTSNNGSMSAHRVEAPDLSGTLAGPASYFPSITKKYGQPIQVWLDIAAGEVAAGKRHSDVVRLLKTEHGMGHGHANAVVAYVRARL